jgi:hypothetical protein
MILFYLIENGLYIYIRGFKWAEEVLSLADMSHSLDLYLKLWVVDLAPEASLTYRILYAEVALNI